jgi:hypothetical protein
LELAQGLAQNTTFSNPGVRGYLVFGLAPVIKKGADSTLRNRVVDCPESVA